MPAALTYAMQVLTLLPTLIDAGQSVIGLVQHANAALAKMTAENRDPSDLEWSELNATIDALRAKLHASE